MRRKHYGPSLVPNSRKRSLFLAFHQPTMQHILKKKTSEEKATTVKPPPTIKDHTKTAFANDATVIPSKSTTRHHWASVASVVPYICDEDDYPKEPSKFSLISQWLIDSGCSNHTTPYKDDLVIDIRESESLVQVANGNLVKAPLKGTIQLHLIDINGKEPQDILVEGVLYVPGLNRRLFSVTQFTSSGGNLSFNGNKCLLHYEDNNEPPTKFTLTLRAPFSAINGAGHLVHPTASFAKVATPLNLLHQRLGHRSIQALRAAS